MCFQMLECLLTPKRYKWFVDWPIPTSVIEVRQFLGLASYYRRYIRNFVNVAAPLYSLPQVNMTFSWNENCTSAFEFFKHCLMAAPVLVCPSFSPNATEFVLETDASAVGLGTVVEQKGHLITYASWSLTSSEHNYSVIQREYLAIVFALKQFHHYLLGHPFQLCTNHAPLQWLSAQKWKACWADGH